jgi:hypothetical protein
MPLLDEPRPMVLIGHDQCAGGFLQGRVLGIPDANRHRELARVQHSVGSI